MQWRMLGTARTPCQLDDRRRPGPELLAAAGRGGGSPARTHCTGATERVPADHQLPELAGDLRSRRRYARAVDPWRRPAGRSPETGVDPELSDGRQPRRWRPQFATRRSELTAELEGTVAIVVPAGWEDEVAGWLGPRDESRVPVLSPRHQGPRVRRHRARRARPDRLRVAVRAQDAVRRAHPGHGAAARHRHDQSLAAP